ncbi:MAG: hypothetical protein M3Q07_16010, partial [Pseudobdellovibrionaceae bacterium]|nr:hypothetical protein [Pseudobdellovibrionaceae bacterium]
MKRILASCFLIGWTATAWGAEELKIPSTEQASARGRSAYASEQKARDRPIRFEQDCPPPEMVDVIQSSSWNTVEMGVSFPLGEGLGQVRPYTRYTCPSPA